MNFLKRGSKVETTIIINMDSEGKLKVIAFLFMLFVGCETRKHFQGGYIFTCPRGIKIGMNNELQLFCLENVREGNILVSLYCAKTYDRNETLVQKQEYKFKDKKNFIFNFFVDFFENTDCYNGIIKISGTIDGKHISGNDTVYPTTTKQHIYFFQTDKPMYKPGQEVKFRALALDGNLRPTGDKCEKAQIFIEDPKGTRLIQYDDVNLSKGIIQRKFPISDDPMFGQWKITLTCDNDTEFTTFEVKNYDPPKFEVITTFPPFVLANAETLEMKVCGLYTFGQPVNGILHLNISRESYGSKKIPVVEKSFQIEGCQNIIQNLSVIDPDNNYRYRRVQVGASITEDGTGVQINKTFYLQQEYTPLYIIFETDQNYKQYIKPGLPFFGRIKVTNPDKTPAVDEPVELCATVSREREWYHWLATRKVKYCRNYTSNCDGYIEYSISPQNSDVDSVELEARSLNYAKQPRNPGPSTVTLNTPTAWLFLTPYYSPSGSYVQLQTVGSTIPCGTEKNIRVLYTAEKDTDFTLLYQISKQGDILKTGSMDVHFNIEEDFSEDWENENDLIQDAGTQIVPDRKHKSFSKRDYSNDDESCPGVKDTKYLPPIGKLDIPVDIDASMSPSFNILIFYVRKDKETVADSQKIEVEKCFKNEVSFEFGDEAKQPGTDTSITVNSSPNSHCGLKVIDKSILLLNPNDQLTKDKIFQVLASRDTGYYYSTDPCNQQIRQPGLHFVRGRRRIFPPRSRGGSSKSADSNDAFQNAGYICISNLIIVTRRCIKSNVEVFPLAVRRMASKSAVRGVAAEAFDMDVAFDGSGTSNTVSAVEVRDDYRDTWLFEMQETDSDGIYTTTATLPHTITEWVGSAVCVSSKDGLGLSNTATIKGFQAFFISFTLPVSVIRGETFPFTVSFFNYVEDKCICISVTVAESPQFRTISDGVSGVVCIQPRKPETRQMKLKAIDLGKVNITVTAETAEATDSEDGCGSYPLYDGLSRDAVRQPIGVEAEGFKVEKTENRLFCPQDEPDQTFRDSFLLKLPNDVIPDSARATVDCTGNLLGPAIQNLNNLVLMPTGCGEQNMVKFTPNYLVLYYLITTNQITESIRQKAIKNLNTGYQRQLKYRRDDGSFSAFGNTDKEGSIFLTAFVMRSFFQARRYISIDESMIAGCEKWIISKQTTDGGFPNVGKIVDYGIEGGIDEKNSIIMTAYVLASLLISGSDNKTAIDMALSYIEKAEDTGNAYQSVICAYAEALAGKKEDAAKRLDNIRPRAIETDGNECFRNLNGTKSLKTEALAYRILTGILIGEDKSKLLEYVRCLTSNLNSQGGFHSTQDTCVGLEALSGFAQEVYAEPDDMLVTLSNTEQEEFEINENIKLLVQRTKVSEVPGEVNVKATGSGCALIQTTLRYNTASPPEKQSFNLEVIFTYTSLDSKEGKITIAVSTKETGKACGMSVLELKLINGYFPRKESLDKLKTDKNNGIAKWEYEKNIVYIYFLEVTNAEIRFLIEVYQGIDIENPQPGTCTVYDYYTPDFKSMVDYSVRNFSGHLPVPETTEL